MLKKLWSWITSGIYIALMSEIDRLDKYEVELAEIIRGIPADKIAKTVVDFFQKKLREIIKRIFNRN